MYQHLARGLYVDNVQLATQEMGQSVQVCTYSKVS